jgi:hypothetical protein
MELGYEFPSDLLIALTKRVLILIKDWESKKRHLMSVSDFIYSKNSSPRVLNHAAVSRRDETCLKAGIRRDAIWKILPGRFAGF